MADTSEPEDAVGVQVAALAESAARIRELNERLIECTMAQGNRTLDAYERALTTLVDLAETASATPLEWLATLAETHADFIRDVSSAYTAAVRVMLD
jgi:chemotaxis protein histidine kinase CheA